MSSEKAEKLKNTYEARFRAAVIALRGKFNWSQEELARCLSDKVKSVSLRQVQNWEAEDEGKRATPSGDYVLAMIELCPDKESLRKFISERGSLPERVTIHPHSDDKEERELDERRRISAREKRRPKGK